MIKAFWKTCIDGLIVLVPAWATFLILSTLFTTLDGVVGRYMSDPLPGLGLLLLVSLLVLAGLIGDHVIGQGFSKAGTAALNRFRSCRASILH